VYIPPGRSSGEPVPIEPYLHNLEAILQTLSGCTLVCGDFNGHNTIWGSERTDQRGDQIHDLIAALNLHILNSTDNPTFYTIRDGVVFQSYIDLTFVSTSLLPRVLGWEVCDKVTSSDHRTIAIMLQLGNAEHLLNSTRRFA